MLRYKHRHRQASRDLSAEFPEHCIHIPFPLNPDPDPSSNLSIPEYQQQLLREYHDPHSPVPKIHRLQRLHASLLGIEEEREHVLVAPWQLNPVYLAGIFETPLAFSTLHKTIPYLSPFAVFYRKAFPSKRQPRHWIRVIDRALEIPAVCVHLMEVYVCFWLGLFSEYNDHLSLERHLELASLWRSRGDWKRHQSFLRWFYCSPDTNKISICAIAESFAFVCKPLRGAMSSISEAWGDDTVLDNSYLFELASICNFIRIKASTLTPPGSPLNLDQASYAHFDKFNSLMASIGPKCVFPVSFWETVLSHVRGDLPEAIPNTLDRPALLTAFISHPGPIDEWETRFVQQYAIKKIYLREVLSSVRFLYAFAPRGPMYRLMIEHLVSMIVVFYSSRMGPSVLRSSIVKRFADHKSVISTLAWRWNALFSTHRVAWSESFEAKAQDRVLSRIHSLQLGYEAQLAVRRIQFCTNCGVIHTHHNGVPPLKSRSSIEVHRAETTVGCFWSSFSLLSGTTYCARNGSKLALRCGETQAVCFYLRGWTYVNYRCFFVCTQCGMQSIWDSSVCFVTYENGPVCSRCTYCISSAPKVGSVVSKKRSR